MDAFDIRKKDVLGKKDKSKAGGIDKPIAALCKLINSKKDYYTTSSCAGRIVLLNMMGKKKNKSRWLLCEHKTVSMADILNSLSEIPKGQTWLRMESLILHVCARDLASADNLMKASQEAGLKHSGIMRIRPRINVELIGNESIVLLVAEERKMVCDEKMIQANLKHANSKLEDNFDKIKRLEEKIKAL